jgi:hypothetical protein
MRALRFNPAAAPVADDPSRDRATEAETIRYLSMRNCCAPARDFNIMTDPEQRIVYPDPSNVSASDGDVLVQGPDAVDVAMTPEAAEETSDRLSDQAVKARGQRRLGKMTHRPQD